MLKSETKCCSRGLCNNPISDELTYLDMTGIKPYTSDFNTLVPFPINSLAQEIKVLVGINYDVESKEHKCVINLDHK